MSYRQAKPDENRRYLDRVGELSDDQIIELLVLTNRIWSDGFVCRCQRDVREKVLRGKIDAVPVSWLRRREIVGALNKE